MKIEKDRVVTFHYSLRSVEGEEVESSRGGEPVAYLHGHGNILTALEQALEGREAGDEFNLQLAPEQAYGRRREDARQRVPIKHLLTAGKLRPGQVVKINTSEGPKDATIIKVGRFNVDVDTNHPLAGVNLSFDITVDSVREASGEELAHGHAHGPGGHHH